MLHHDQENARASRRPEPGDTAITRRIRPKSIALAGIAGAASLVAPRDAASAASTEKAAKPLNILILGGTGFTGPHQVRYALARGHKLTLFNRGKRPKKEWPGEVEEITGDRAVETKTHLD